MINKATIKENKIKEVIKSITCDICGKTYFDHFEHQEFHLIRFTGGYGSIFGDENEIECDICQKCLHEMIKDKYRITFSMDVTT